MSKVHFETTIRENNGTYELLVQRFEKDELIAEKAIPLVEIEQKRVLSLRKQVMKKHLNLLIWKNGEKFFYAFIPPVVRISHTINCNEHLCSKCEKCSASMEHGCAKIRDPFYHIADWVNEDMDKNMMDTFNSDVKASCRIEKYADMINDGVELILSKTNESGVTFVGACAEFEPFAERPVISAKEIRLRIVNFYELGAEVIACMNRGNARCRRVSPND